MMPAVALPLPLQERLRDEAIRAYPRECCGLLEGFADGVLLRVIALHPTANLAQQPDRFEIDPAAHIALQRALRGTGRSVLGCYHSHPNGRAEPSGLDRENADEGGFLWLIVAVKPDMVERTRLVAFVRNGQSFSPVKIVNALPGIAGVPPARAPEAAAVLVRLA